MRRRWRRGEGQAGCAAGWAVAFALVCVAAQPGLAEGRGEISSLLRVGTSGDYAPFSAGRGGSDSALDGFDIAVARAYAEERGRTLAFVRFRWPYLLRDLGAEKFDVAMSGITVRPERSAAGRFTIPVVESGAVLLVDQSSSWRNASDANSRKVRIGVNAGGHLERVAQAHFPEAVLVSIPENRAVLRALVGYRVDAAVSDSLEAPKWLSEAPGFKAIGPFTLDRKAYLVHADLPGLARDLDRWLLERERDGTLARLREHHLGIGESGGEPLATPLRSLLASMDERLSLMPLVGAFKRRNGLPLEVPEREKAVLEAAVAGVRAAARSRGTDVPPEKRIRALFRAQMEAAKQVQWSSVRAEEIATSAPLPDLTTALRPALLRLGERIAERILALPQNLDAAVVERVARQELRTRHLSPASRIALAESVVALSRSRQ